MSTARRTFQAAFWETEDMTGRSALQRKHESIEEAEADVARQLAKANYRAAGVYEWDEAKGSWKELRTFQADEMPFQIH